MDSQNGMSSPLQRIIIGVGTLIVVILTVIAAIFLAMQSQPSDEEATPISQQSPPAIATTTTPATATPTFTSIPPPPSDTPTTTLEPPTPVPPPTSTDTPVALPPTFTATPVVIVVTSTPLPPTPTPPPASGCPTTPPNWVEYVVQTGDTLNSLAGRTNVSVFDLQQANCLTSFTIQAGQRLYLPFTPPPPTLTPTRPAANTPGPTPTRTPTAIAPVISQVVPDRVDKDNEGVIITVLGRNFRPTETGFTVELRGPQNLSLQLGDTRTDTNFDAFVPSGLPVGTYDIVVTNANNRAGVRESAFIIGEAPPTPTPAPGPRIDNVAPDEGFNDTDVIINVTGIFFRPNETGFLVQLRIGQEIRAELEKVGSSSSTSFNAIVPAGLAPEVYDLWVINPDGKQDVEPGAYRSLTR